MHLHDIALVLIAFFSELLGTLSGFGSSTFFVPLALWVESFQFVLALTAILHCFGNSWRMLIFRKHFDLKSFALLALPAIVFTGIGAFLTTRLPIAQMQMILGAILIALSLFFIFGKQFSKQLPKWVAIVLSIASGFFTGLVGTGGALRGMALSALQIPKHAFVMTSASVDMGGDLLRAGIYLGNGYMDWSQWFYIPLLGVAAFVGAKIGQRIIDKLSQEQFEKIVAVFVLISGCLMLVKS